MNFEVHPLVLLSLGSAFLALVVAFCAYITRDGRIRAFLIVVMLALLIPGAGMLLMLHPELIDGRIGTYKAFYGDIQAGMTREEVFAAMDRRYPAEGSRQRPTVMEDKPDRLGFFMNPEDSGEPNCEGIFLELNQGRVAGKNYSSD